MERFGTIKINLAELIEQRGISKNKLSQRAEMQRTQLNNYCNNTISRLDIVSVKQSSVLRSAEEREKIQ